MSMRFERTARIGEAVRDAAPASLAARVGSLVPAAVDPHTLAITVWNGAPTTTGGRIEVDLNLQDEAEGYELVDAEGEPVPHIWLGDRGVPPTRLDLTRPEVPDFEGIMARIDGDRVLGMGILAVSMRVLRDTLHIELTLGDRNGLSRAELAESVRDALSLADDADCRRLAVTLHRAVVPRLAAWVPTVPACGYTTLLLRPRPKGGSRTPKVAAMPAELIATIEEERYGMEADPSTGVLRDARPPSHGISGASPDEIGSPFPTPAAWNTKQHAFAFVIGRTSGDQRTLPGIAGAFAVDLPTYVAPCVEGALPPSASVVTVSPETVMVSAFQWKENGDGAILRLCNESDHAENARVSLVLPAYSAELTGLEERPDEILWEGEPRTDFTVAVPPGGIVMVRLRL